MDCLLVSRDRLKALGFGVLERDRLAGSSDLPERIALFDQRCFVWVELGHLFVSGQLSSQSSRPSPARAQARLRHEDAAVSTGGAAGELICSELTAS